MGKKKFFSLSIWGWILRVLVILKPILCLSGLMLFSIPLAKQNQDTTR